MTSSNTLKKLVSIGAAILLAVGGSLTSASPASAAEVTNVSLGGGSGLQSGMGSLSLGVGTCNSYTGTINLADWQITLSSGSQTITGVTLAGYMVVGLSANLTSGQTVTIAYTKNVSRVITCNNGDTVGSFSYTGTVSGGQVNVSTRTVTTPPGTPTLVNGVLTRTSSATWSSAGNPMSAFWLACSTPQGAAQGTSGGPDASCGPISTTALNNQAANWVGTATLSLGATVNKWVSCGGGSSCTTAAVAIAGQHFTWYESDGGPWTMSATIASDGTVGSSSVSVAAPRLTAEQAKNALKPIPAAVQPLVPALLALNKPMASLGGKVSLSAGDFTGLVSAKIAGKSLDFILGKTGQITMTVPQGEAGKTADLVLTFNTGSIILQDAIKYVAPVVVAAVPARPVSVSSSSKSFSEEAQSEIRQAAFANVKNTAVACVGYAAENTASARDAAVALATKACAIANKANSDLAITGVNVVVDKLKARTQGVGIKVYKADN